MARILVVDDIPDVRDLIAQIFEFGGHKTLLAGGGCEALRMIEEERPDLVVLDISMPGMNGFEVLQAMPRRAGEPEIPVVMMTAMADEATRDRAIELGAKEYFVKGDFDIDDMLARVDAHVEEASSS